MNAEPFQIEQFDREYCNLASGPLNARIYKPIGAAPFPAVVEVHGGGWMSGDRLSDATINEALARSGIVVVSIDFRMAPESKFPSSVRDVNAAIRWVKEHADELATHPALVGGLGTSSGGHQLLLNALAPDHADHVHKTSSAHDASLRFVIACWPVSDPWARYQMAQQNALQFLIDAHTAYWPSESDMKRGNPQLLLERGDFSNLPPLLVLEGTKDENLPRDMNARFASYYENAGGIVELLSFKDQTHAFITRNPESTESQQALSAIAAFILKYAHH